MKTTLAQRPRRTGAENTITPERASLKPLLDFEWSDNDPRADNRHLLVDARGRLFLAKQASVRPVSLAGALRWSARCERTSVGTTGGFEALLTLAARTLEVA